MGPFSLQLSFRGIGLICIEWPFILTFHYVHTPYVKGNFFVRLGRLTYGNPCAWATDPLFDRLQFTTETANRSHIFLAAGPERNFQTLLSFPLGSHSDSGVSLAQSIPPKTFNVEDSRRCPSGH